MSTTLASTSLPASQTRTSRGGKGSKSTKANIKSDATSSIAPNTLDVEFMDDPALHEDDAQRKLFARGLDVPRARVDWYHQLADFRAKGEVSTGSTPSLLTAAQERVLFLRFNYARMRVVRATEALEGLPKSRKLKAEIRRWRVRSLELREQIAEYNLGLVLAMSKRAVEAGMDLGEVISEGNLALLRAIDKFRIERGFKFSTYACNAINHALGRSRKRWIRQRKRFCASYEPDYDKSDFHATRVAAHEQDCIEELRGILKSNASDLTDTERKVIGHRFFQQQEDGKRMTLVEVGKLIGMTKERVRQIQNRALSKLRTTLDRNFLDPGGPVHTPTSS